MPEPFVLTLLLAMFLAIALLSTFANRLHASTPVVMLIAGVVIALLPGVPPITLDPDLTLLGLLPPLLYAAGVGMSWRGFRSNLRPILSLAIGCVLYIGLSPNKLCAWTTTAPRPGAQCPST